MDKLEIMYGMTSRNRNAYNRRRALVAHQRVGRIIKYARAELSARETGSTKIDGTLKMSQETRISVAPNLPSRFVIPLKSWGGQ